VTFPSLSDLHRIQECGAERGSFCRSGVRTSFKIILVRY
jgi:hypothetical protein